MRKATDAFRSIGEVSQLVGVPPHVLRYWETQFPQLAPVKRADGRRYYRPEDLHLAAGLCELLREEGMTTRGAARMIARDKGAALRARGLARLPERFRSEAEAPAGDDTVQAADPAEALAPELRDGGEAPAATATSPPPEVAPQGREGEADAPPESGGSAAAAQGESRTPATAASEGTGTMTTPEGEATAHAAAAPREAAAEPPVSQAAPAEAGAEAAPSREAAPEVPRDAAAPAPAAGAEAPAREATAPAASLLEAGTPPPEAEGQAEALPVPSGGESAQAAVPARHPAPTAADLPLFPGLAPAAPPPGIWLPRLASAADALRTMTPPRRPPAQMQWLRDRLAALVDPEA